MPRVIRMAGVKVTVTVRPDCIEILGDTCCGENSRNWLEKVPRETTPEDVNTAIDNMFDCVLQYLHPIRMGYTK